jgi:hypothetical protein
MYSKRCSVCGPANIFLMYKFIWLYSFPLPPIKLKLELQIDGWTTNSNPPSRLIRIRREQQTYRIYYTLLLWQVLKVFAVPFYQASANSAKMLVRQNHFADFFLHRIFICRGLHTAHRWSCSNSSVWFLNIPLSREGGGIDHGRWRVRTPLWRRRGHPPRLQCRPEAAGWMHTTFLAAGLFPFPPSCNLVQMHMEWMSESAKNNNISAQLMIISSTWDWDQQIY